MVEKQLAFDSRNNRNMKTNKKGSRGSMSNRHGKNTKVQNSFGGFGGGSNSLNWRNESPKNAVSESNNYGYNNHYVANAFYSLIGLQVEIQKKDAIIYEGILETVSNKVEFHLSHVCEKSNINGTKSEKMAKKLIFPFSDVVYCRAPNVDLEFAKRDTLLTDSAISSNTNGSYNERELVQWQPDDNNGVTFHDLGDHDPNLGWAFDDMMRVNEEEHGVKSTFDSSMSSYMTPLDKGDEEEFKAQERRAEQVARAIQKDPGFKDVDNVDSGLGEEDMFSSVSRAANNYNSIPTNNSSTATNPNNSDGFTTFTGKNYRGGRHATPTANTVGPRLQRNHNTVRTQDGGQNHMSPGNQQTNRNHSSSPQRTQPGNPSRNSNSYPQQMTPPQKHHHQQAPSYQRIEHQKVSVPSHPVQDNSVPNTRVPQNDQAVTVTAAAANPARPGLSYSAVAMKKDPPPPVVNNRVPPPPPASKPNAPPGLPDVVAPPPQEEVPISTLTSQPPVEQVSPPPVAAPVVAAPIVEAASLPQPPPPVVGEQVSEALAAAKQQIIQDARKKAGMGLTEPTTETIPSSVQTAVSLVPSVSTVTTTATLPSVEVTTTLATSSVISSPVRHQTAANPPPPKAAVPPIALPAPPAEKVLPPQPRQPKVEALEKTMASMEIKPEVPAVVPCLKEQRIRGEETKQPFLMKYGKIQHNPPEEKKPGSYKELKEFGEQFKLESKPPKKRSPKTLEQAAKVPEVLPPKTESTVPEIKPQEPQAPQPSSAAKTECSSQISAVVVTTSTMTVVSSICSAATATVTSTITASSSEEPPSPSRKSSLNPSAKEFTLSATAKEFNPGRESSSPFTPSPKQSPARPSSSNSTPTQHPGPIPHQPYYHTNQQGTVMIHPNAPEVISPTVQSVPHKIYARPYMATGPGGSTTIQYSIPAVPFNNNSNTGPQIIAAPQSAQFISQNPTGQQMIIIHPNEPYQPIVQPGQPGQQYYPMQQMIRCVPGHPNSSSVQQAVAAAARVPGNFQQQDGSPGYVLTAVSQHGGLVQHPSVPGGNQHQNYHPPQSPGQSSHIQTQYAITHPSPSSYLQNPQSPAQITHTQGNTGPSAFRSPSSMHSVATGQHHPQQPFVMVTHQGQHMQTVAVPNNQTYVQGQQYGGGILQNYQTGN